MWQRIWEHNLAVTNGIMHGGFQRCGLSIPFSAATHQDGTTTSVSRRVGEKEVETTVYYEPLLVLAIRFGANLFTLQSLIAAGADVGAVDCRGYDSFSSSYRFGSFSTGRSVA